MWKALDNEKSPSTSTNTNTNTNTFGERFATPMTLDSRQKEEPKLLI